MARIDVAFSTSFKERFISSLFARKRLPNFSFIGKGLQIRVGREKSEMKILQHRIAKMQGAAASGSLKQPTPVWVGDARQRSRLLFAAKKIFSLFSFPTQTGDSSTLCNSIQLHTI